MLFLLSLEFFNASTQSMLSLRNLHSFYNGFLGSLSIEGDSNFEHAIFFILYEDLYVEKSAMKLYFNEHRLDRMVFVQKLMNRMKLLVNQRSNTSWFDMCCNGVFNSISRFIHVRQLFSFFKKGIINVLSPHAQSELIRTSSERREQFQQYTNDSNVFMIHCDEKINFIHYQTDLIAFTSFCLTDFSSFSSNVCLCTLMYLFPFFGILKLHLHCFRR